MLRGLFDLDNPVMRFLSRVADLLVLNLLFILCSIPIFTIGASITALYYCFFKMKDQEEGYLAKRFFKSFKENFKQATIRWLLLLILFLVLGFEFLIFRTVPGTTGTVIRAVILVGLIFWFLITVYSFALLSRFYNSIKNTFMNAGLLIFGNGPRSIAIAAVAALMVGLSVSQTNVMIFWNLILFWFLLGIAINAMINVELMYPVFKKLMPEEVAEETTPDNEFVVDEEADLSSIGYAPAPPKPEAEEEPAAESKDTPTEEASSEDTSSEAAPSKDTSSEGM